MIRLSSMWPARASRISVFAIAASAAVAHFAPTAFAAEKDAADSEAMAPVTSSNACSRTTQEAADSCAFGARSDFRLALGTCANVSNDQQRTKCIAAAKDALSSAKDDCGAQEDARKNVCTALGEAPYDPPIRPTDFVRVINNQYFPLIPGTTFIYKQKADTITVVVTHKTIKILGVTCTVVRDTDVADGKVQEDTYDYYAQDTKGNIWYFGEQTAQYENGLPIGVEGAWIAGVDGAKPGIAMLGNPKFGITYRQEFALGTAEDMARTTGLNKAASVPYGAYNNALRTYEFSGLEPDAKEYKYYVPGVGQVLTIDLVTGDREELISIKHGR